MNSTQQQAQNIFITIIIVIGAFAAYNYGIKEGLKIERI